MKKDTLEKATEPNLNIKTYLQDAYVHPVFKGAIEFERPRVIDEEENNPLVLTKRSFHRHHHGKQKQEEEEDTSEDRMGISAV